MNFISSSDRFEILIMTSHVVIGNIKCNRRVSKTIARDYLFSDKPIVTHTHSLIDSVIKYILLTNINNM